jgi:3-dehydroquinate dehydratase-2
MNIFVINGPNINRLGLREPEIYGTTTYKQLVEQMTAYAELNGIEFTFVQSNHEGELIDLIHSAAEADGIIINPAGYSHTSISIMDALKSISVPIVEVHISNVYERESFRHSMITAKAADAVISGMGIDGYLYAAAFLANLIDK